MQVTEIKSEGLQRQYRVVVPASDIKAEFEGRLVEVGKSAEIKGFRKGHVPPAVLRQRYGASILGEVLEKAVGKSSRAALEEKGVRPALQPKVEVTKFSGADSDLEYTLAVEVVPAIEPMDFSTLEIARHTIAVGEKEVDEALSRMAEREKLFEPVSEPRAAATGDQVVIDFTGFRGDAPIEGGAAQGLELELGSGHLIPGFEDQLVGAKAGQRVEVHVTFPDNYPAAELAGELARFEVDIKELRAPKSVDVDAGFAERRGFASLDALKEALKKQLESEYAQLARGRAKRALFERLVEEHDFELPSGMVEAEFEHAWKHLKEDMERGNQTFETLGKSEEEVKAETRSQAERRVRLGLLLGEIGRRNNVEIESSALLRAAVGQAMRQFPGQEQQALEFYRKNPQALEQFRPALFEDKVVDFILGQAKGEEKTVTAEEFVALDRADAAGAGAEERPVARGGKKPAAKKKAAPKPSKA